MMPNWMDACELFASVSGLVYIFGVIRYCKYHKNETIHKQSWLFLVEFSIVLWILVELFFAIGLKFAFLGSYRLVVYFIKTIADSYIVAFFAAFTFEKRAGSFYKTMLLLSQVALFSIPFLFFVVAMFHEHEYFVPPVRTAFAFNSISKFYAWRVCDEFYALLGGIYTGFSAILLAAACTIRTRRVGDTPHVRLITLLALLGMVLSAAKFYIGLVVEFEWFEAVMLGFFYLTFFYMLKSGRFNVAAQRR